MTTLTEYRERGFNLVLAGADAFKVVPASNLTQEERDYLRSHKEEILSELSAEHASNESAAPSAPSTPTRVATSTVTSTSPEKGRFDADQNGGLSTADRKTLHDYMALIGEDDDDMVSEYLATCASDPAILAAQLRQARDALLIAEGKTSDFVKCRGCKHLTGNTCQKHQAKVIINRWRKCETGKVLEHFASLDKALH